MVSESPLQIPKFDQLEARFKRLLVFESALLWILVGLSVSMLYYLVVYQSTRLLLLPLLIFFVNLFLYGGWFYLDLFWQKKQRAKRLNPNDKVGEYTGEEIRAMVEELFEPHRGKELPAIYITERSDSFAHVVDSLWFNFLKPLNAVYLSKDLFYYLKRGEILSTLSHELAHFYHYMYPISRTKIILPIFLSLAPVFIVASIGIFSAHLLFLIWMLLQWSLFWALGKRDRAMSQTMEFLCDHHAAKRFGVLNSINDLLMMSRVNEAYNLMQRHLLLKIKKDPRLSIKDFSKIFDKVEETLPEGPFSTWKMKAVIAEVLASEEFRKKSKKLRKKQLKEEAEGIAAAMDSLVFRTHYRLLPWENFDLGGRDGRIDAQEYPLLIRAIKEDPQAQLFATYADDLEAMAEASHPALRERILFLDSCKLPLHPKTGLNPS